LNAATLELAAAFLSGAAAVLSAFVSLRIARKRAEEDCRQRIELVRAAIREGFELRE
jgi:hypothetical protein